jgi:hypothetical protein
LTRRTPIFVALAEEGGVVGAARAAYGATAVRSAEKTTTIILTDMGYLLCE